MSSILNCGQKMTFSSYHIGKLVDADVVDGSDYTGTCELRSPYEDAPCSILIKWYEGEGFLVLFGVYDDNNIYSYQTPYAGLVSIKIIKNDVLSRFKDDIDENGKSNIENIYEELVDKTIRTKMEVPIDE